jgi:hypothetical protein
VPRWKKIPTRRGARTLGDVSYATVWRRRSQRHCLDGGPRNHGRPRLPAALWRKVEIEVAANPEATQQALARKIGVSRSTVGRVVRARRAGLAATQ